MQRLLLLLIGLATLGSATKVDSSCSWGESHWCSSLENAKKCGAFGHCKTTIWKNQILKEDQSEICQFCENIVQDLHQYILDNKTQQEILRFMSNVCQMIPQQSMASECQALVNSYMPEIIQLVASEMDPQMVCSLLKLCQGLEDTVHHSPSKPSSSDAIKPVQKFSPLNVNSEPICTDCKKFFTDIKNMFLSNATEEEIEQLIDTALCAYLGSYEAECKALVKEFLPELMQLLAEDYDPNVICQSFGFCAQTLSEAKTFLIKLKLQKSAFYQKARQGTAEECAMCKLVMNEIVSLDRDKTVQSDIEGFLKTYVCDKLGAYAATCSDFVDAYGPMLFELIATELDPDSRCRSLGFCTADNTIRDPVREATPIRKPVYSHVSQSVQCVLCEFIMKELDSLISQNSTEAEIVAALEKVCSMLPSSLKTSCDDFVKTYGKAIIDMLLQEMDPATICTALGLCQSSRIQMPASVPNDVRCVVCETVVQYLESLLEENATIAEIEAALKKVCNFLPESLQPECNFIVQLYGPYIVQYISQDLTPQQVCSMAGVCSAVVKKPDPEVVVPVKAKLVGENKCTWGPAHWCNSRENAAECKATEYCELKG